MSDPASMLAELDALIAETKILLAEVEGKTAAKDPASVISTKELQADMTAKPESIQDAPADEAPALPTTIEVKMKKGKGYGYVATQINQQMAVFPDWKPIKGKELRGRMGGQMLWHKSYSFKTEELMGSTFLAGGVTGKALKKAMQAGKSWRTGGRARYLAKVKADKAEKAKAAEEAKAAAAAKEKADQEAFEAEEAEKQRKYLGEFAPLEQSLGEPDSAEQAPDLAEQAPDLDAIAAQAFNNVGDDLAAGATALSNTPLPSKAVDDAVLSKNGVEIPVRLQDSEVFAHMAYKDVEQGPDGKLRLRRCQDGDSEREGFKPSSCVSKEEEAWMAERGVIEEVTEDPENDYRAVTFFKGEDGIPWSSPDMDPATLAVRGTKEGREWPQQTAAPGAPGQPKTEATKDLTDADLRYMNEVTGQRSIIAGHSQAANQGIAAAARNPHLVSHLDSFAGVGTTPQQANDFIKQQREAGPDEKVEVTEVIMTGDKAHLTGSHVPTRVIEVDPYPNCTEEMARDLTLAEQAVGLTSMGKVQELAKEAARIANSHRAMVLQNVEQRNVTEHSVHPADRSNAEMIRNDIIAPVIQAATGLVETIADRVYADVPLGSVVPTSVEEVNHARDKTGRRGGTMGYHQESESGE